MRFTTLIGTARTDLSAADGRAPGHRQERGRSLADTYNLGGWFTAAGVGKLPLGKLPLSKLRLRPLYRQYHLPYGKLPLRRLPLSKLPLSKLRLRPLYRQYHLPYGKLPFRRLPLGKLPLVKLPLNKLQLQPHHYLFRLSIGSESRSSGVYYRLNVWRRAVVARSGGSKWA